VVADLLPRFGIESTVVDGRDLAAWKKAVRPNTKAFFLESPSNPTLEIVDIGAVASIAHAGHAKLIVDNVFATPMLQQPLALGADIVVYSATKHIDGQGRCLGGAVLADKAFVTDHLQMFIRNTGPSLSPFNAWVLLKSLETLDLRVREHGRIAALLADHLAQHPKVKRVIYPGRDDHPQAALAKRQMSGGGSLIAFEIDGGRAEAFRVENNLQIIDISNNLGDAKSLITHPATTTHHRLTPEGRAELGIGDNLLRLSVGLEDSEDLAADLDQALNAI
jgi:O-succinylhomoserine sulfhydrylase